MKDSHKKTVIVPVILVAVAFACSWHLFDMTKTPEKRLKRENAGERTETDDQIKIETVDTESFKAWPLVMKLGDHGAPSSRAVEELVEIGLPAVDPLITALGDGNPVVRENAVKALGEIGDPCVVESLIGMLKDDEEKVSKGAVNALEEIGDPRAVEPLIEMLENDIWRIRYVVENVLIAMDNPDIVDLLIVKLQDEDLRNRSRVPDILRRIGDLRAVEPLIHCLNHRIFRYSINSAALALGEIGDPRAVEPLIEVVNEKDFFLKRILYDKLYQIYIKKDTHGLHNSPIEELMRMLEYENENARLNAITALGKIGDPRAFETLTDALKDEKIFVRMYAAEALGELGDTRAIEPLLKARKKRKNKDIHIQWRINIALDLLEGG